MREILSERLVEEAKSNEKFVVLSGDHGYALFDPLRKFAPDQFINAGIMEQAMVGIASGLNNVGYKTVVYGLASFIPMRVLEQIRLDVCFSNSPVKFIGDGAGVVYSYLGNSHFCSEDIACLMPLPNIEIYSPGTTEEMKVCLNDFFKSSKPAYLRIGKSDNPSIDIKLQSTLPYFSNKSESNFCLVSVGSMNGISSMIAKDLNISHISITKIKPFNDVIFEMLKSFNRIIIIEEHHFNGGLFSIFTSASARKHQRYEEMYQIAFKDQFIKNAGSYQYALSEHEMSFSQLRERIGSIVKL